MWIRIDGRSGVPIYRQIAEQIEQAVLAGVLQTGDKLPAVREMGVELAVNPATVARAYDELQRRAVIEQPRGRGTFVRGRPALTASERRSRLRAAVEGLAVEAERLGFAPSDLLAMVRSVLELGVDAEGADLEEESHAGR